MAEERGKSDVARREEAILAFWKDQNIFEKTLAKDAPNGEFVFYDGPPFATGLPHPGSLLSSVSKDVIPRYKTMRGYRVRRRWGWDTHGLPIESIVEKELGLKSKKDILELGVEKFNDIARSKVLEYVHDWKRYIERVGRFVDFDNSYKTMDPSYTESVWWALKQIHDAGRLYEGRKVLMYCPHCETPLAKAEIAMDHTYKDITEDAVTAKFKVKEPKKHGLPENTYLLAWTTTPWTLPGNVALAVGSNMDYVLARQGDAHLVVAKERSESLLPGAGVIREFKGKSLLGIAYEPLYEVEKVNAHPGKKWTVLPADFVTADEGTGIVHTAVIYGEDDYQLGLKEGLPMIPILNPNATYNADAPEFLRGKYIKKAETDIKADLEKRGLLFAKAPHTHSYPHCYRCGTPLIYNAVASWFIDIQSVKKKLLSENENVAWSPDHLKHGRFQHIVENAPDWTISRNRFWASPLPIWKDKKGNVTVIGSLEELRARTKRSGNRYFVMRHGEAENNVRDELDSTDEKKWPLTEKGRSQTQEAAGTLRKEGITKIFASPFARTRETALLVAHALGLPESAVTFDDRLRDFHFGELSGTSHADFIERRKTMMYTERPPGGASYQDEKTRFGEFLYWLEHEHADETILIVSHGISIEALRAVVKGENKKESKVDTVENPIPGFAEPVRLDFVPLPHNRDFELDYHLPFIDEVQLVSKEGEPLTRVPEVVDCWVESGSMPFAEYHFPFENRTEFVSRFPGDFVSEYIGQTRAWFYYMHVMAVQLFGHAPFKHVVTTGTILAADGEKLSKSKRNYTDPYLLFDQYGADAFRFYLMGSVVMQAEDLQFRDEEVKEAQNRVINMLRNVHTFYTLYKEDLHPSYNWRGEHVLDQWILARLREVTETATEALDRYDTPRAARPMREFVDDLSTWYVRRSRDRIKGADENDKQEALHTLRHVLNEFSKIIASITPFIADEIYRDLREEGDPESVHLTDWPGTESGSVFDGIKRLFSKDDSDTLIAGMMRVRTIASEGLMLRQKANIKVRQPLQSLSVPDDLELEFQELLKDEMNVKEIKTHAAQVALDTDLTPSLVKEGDVREFARALADARKALGLSPRDLVTLNVEESARELLSGVQLAGVKGITFGATDTPYSADLSFGKVSFGIHAA